MGCEAVPVPETADFQAPPGYTDPVVMGFGLRPPEAPPAARTMEPGSTVAQGPTITPSKAAVTPMLGGLVHQGKLEGPAGVLRQPVPELEPGARELLTYCQGYVPYEAAGLGVKS
jgi:hypothetical protein